MMQLNAAGLIEQYTCQRTALAGLNPTCACHAEYSRVLSNCNAMALSRRVKSPLMMDAQSLTVLLKSDRLP